MNVRLHRWQRKRCTFPRSSSVSPGSYTSPTPPLSTYSRTSSSCGQTSRRNVHPSSGQPYRDSGTGSCRLIPGGSTRRDCSRESDTCAHRVGSPVHLPLLLRGPFLLGLGLLLSPSKSMPQDCLSRSGSLIGAVRRTRTLRPLRPPIAECPHQLTVFGKDPGARGARRRGSRPPVACVTLDQPASVAALPDRQRGAPVVIGRAPPLLRACTRTS